MKKNYLIMMLIFCSGIAAPINQFKVPPMMQKIIENMDVGLMSSGWLMSCFALSGLVFALPAGFFLQKAGIKKLSLIALGTIMAGSAIGLSTDSFVMLLVGRAIEGAGMSLISVTAPAAITAWFAPEKRGVPMGIWATWVPAGNIVIFAVAPYLASWRDVWGLTFFYTLAMFILFLMFFSMPAKQASFAGRDAHAINGSIIPKDVWLFAVIFMLFNIVTISVKSYLPVFLEIEHGFASVKASGITTIMMICSISTAPLTGIMSARIGSNKKIVAFACVIAVTSLLMMFNLSGVKIILPLMLLGIAGGAMPVGVFKAVTDIAATPEKAGAYMSAIIFGQYTGMFLGPVMFGFFAENIGWQAASWMLVFSLFLAFFFCIQIDRRKGDGLKTC